MIFSTYNGFYIQNDGLAMGSPPALHLANGWLISFEKRKQGNCIFYERYRDDIICELKKVEIEDMLKIINDLHPSLSFTYELEKDNKIPFLDMLIINNNGKLASS